MTRCTADIWGIPRQAADRGICGAVVYHQLRGHIRQVSAFERGGGCGEGDGAAPLPLPSSCAELTDMVRAAATEAGMLPQTYQADPVEN